MTVPEVSAQTGALGSLLKELFPLAPAFPASQFHSKKQLLLQNLGNEAGPGAVSPAAVQTRGQKS